MIFATEGAVEDILAGRKTQTRRLKKPHESLAADRTVWKACKKKPMKILSESEAIPYETGWRLKWQVGRDYAVQLGRGKPGLWYCPKCKSQVFKHISINSF